MTTNEPAAIDLEAAKLGAILKSAAAAIVAIDGRGRIETVNPAVERMFGYAAGEVVGRNNSLLMIHVKAADLHSSNHRPARW